MNSSDKPILDFALPKAAWVNQQNKPTSDLEFQIEQIRMQGYTVLENCYSEQELQEIRDGIDSVYATQVAEIGDEKLLYEIGDADIARQLLAYDENFLKYATNERLINIVRHFLGQNFILYQQNANIHRPNVAHTSVPWHRDLTFWHYTSSKPLAISTVHIIDDYTEETGGLYFLPSSHKHDEFPSFEFVEANRRFLTPKAGSIVVFDSMVFHSPGVNRSNRIKRSMNNFYTLHLIAQQVSIPKLLKGKWSDDPFLRNLLGYNAQQQPSVKEWRTEKHKNRRKTLPVY